MADLVRFGVSVDKSLISEFDKLIKRRKYSNRSEAFRDMIRQELIDEKWEHGGEVVGAITLVYDHHHRELVNKLTNIQHDFQKMIISTQHIHLDHDNCMEIIAIKGRAFEIKDLSYKLKAIKGVKHSMLSMSGTGSGRK